MQQFEIGPGGSVRHHHPERNFTWLEHPRHRCGSWPEQPTFPLGHPHFATDQAAFREILRRKDVLPGQRLNELPGRNARVEAALNWANANGFHVAATDFDDAEDLTLARELHPQLLRAPLRETHDQ